MALQVEVVPVHCRVSLEHVWPAPQLEQRPPLVPQNDDELPVRQTVPSQHPSGHVLALHVPVVVMHCLVSDEHVCVEPHAAHASPPVPHAEVELPARHTAPSQQPAQFSEVQVLALPPPPVALPPPVADPPPPPDEEPPPPPAFEPRGTQKPRLQNVSGPHSEQVNALVPHASFVVPC